MLVQDKIVNKINLPEAVPASADSGRQQKTYYDELEVCEHMSI